MSLSSTVMNARLDARLARAINIADLRHIAQKRLPKAVFEFIDGGAGDEITLRENRAAFDRTLLRPRILNDVSQPDMQTPWPGRVAQAPIVIAPMGSCMLAWPQADIAIARAAASLGLPYTLSTMSTTSIEAMADAVQGDLWFQLYVLKEHAFNDQLVQRAHAAGYGTLVVTLDLQAGGKRERDLRNGITVPLQFNLRQVLSGLAHPAWAWQMLRGGSPQYENVKGYMGQQSANLTIAAKVGQSLDPAYNWDDLARLRDRWKGQLMVKGVAHPDDAWRLAQMGVDTLWLSNHGGRQLDGAAATLDALPAIARRLGGKMPLLLDSGVRRGVDILKAHSLGAKAVAVGRAVLYGAAAGGEAGARHALQILIDELRLSMKLSGVARWGDGPALLAPQMHGAPLAPAAVAGDAPSR
jgi:isopentenyl diphosphate isomerase/L-lactate dehydrogenase-like FMN-dependent dehydrogenase